MAAALQSPSLLEWLNIGDNLERYEAPFTDEMRRQCDMYYFHHYAHHFSYGAIGQALAHIPKVMTMDDHDAVDGWGSYPLRMQFCPVFKVSCPVFSVRQQCGWCGSKPSCITVYLCSLPHWMYCRLFW